MNSENRRNDAFTEEDSSFDLLGWILKILHYWYLFVISLAICFGLAYLKNKSWKPIYKTSARIILGEGENSFVSSEYNFMQGFSGSSTSRNMQNQVIMFSSRDIISRAISQLDFTVDYYTRGRFKTNYLYKISPVEIVNYTIKESGYGREFIIVPIDESSFEVRMDKENQTGFAIKANYGFPVETPYFTMTAKRLSNFDNNIYFKFRSPVDLENDFSYRLKLDFAKERSTVLEVSLQGENPKRDEDFINEICLQYQAFNLERKNDAAIKTINFIDEQLSYLSDSLLSTEERMRVFRSQSGIIDLSSYAGQLISKGSDIESAFGALNLKESYLDYLTQYLDGNVKDNNVMMPSGMGVNDPVLITLVDDFMKMNEKISQIGEMNPYYPIYTKQLDDLKVRMYEVLKNMKATLEIEKKDLSSRQKKLSSGIVSLTDKERIIQNIQRHYKINENYYNFLLQKRADAQIKKASNSPDNIILDKARASGVVNGGVKSKTYSSHILIGLVLPFLFVVLRTMLDSTIRTKRDVEKTAPYPIIGTIMLTSFKERLPVLYHPKSLFTEKFREIRTRIEFIAQKTKGISVTVTSTEPGDGKTFISANLAATYGFSSKKTLLIDMDYRRPSQSRLLGIQTEKGISNFLIGQIKSLEEILVKDESFNFDFLPAGTVPPNPGELIKMDKLHQLLEQLKKEYDYIIIDTSPIGLVSDGYTIAGMVDLMLYVVRQNKTNKKFFKNTVNQLKQDGLNNVNIIMNGTDSATGYGYNYGYSRYYGFWKKSSYHTDRAGYYAEEYFDQDQMEDDGHYFSHSKKKRKSKINL
jgi:capsular exopolysaccharide synthesis family protein